MVGNSHDHPPNSRLDTVAQPAAGQGRLSLLSFFMSIRFAPLALEPHWLTLEHLPSHWALCSRAAVLLLEK
jgi:hypothetical protein